ncbi:COP1-interacting protein 7-like [Aristolochia californica]|uniref:COP1-interacting protein 7-like n=1 Tax=Aristolochia californica TaxID=171875 RepID=UPI0035E33BBF
MKSETRLDSVVFQLTPTRTRFDLVIIANGRTEKIASGLLNPFLAHLKMAQDQIAKGGYSIKLEPETSSDLTWFTKGTVERFMRFVSTPEVLERVNTIESEIIQIDDAIAIQSNENLGLNTAEDRQTRSSDSTEGSKLAFDADSEKAIILYKPGVHTPESNGSAPAQEENSKVQLLRVLETRRTVLQNEQGMAFARAVAAGFDMDNLAHLVSFAECFGASRLREACLRFRELWKRKHETGQWVEIEAAEAMSAQSDFSSINASGRMLSVDTRKQMEFSEGWFGSNGQSESNGKTSVAIDNSSDSNGDKRPPLDSQVPYGQHEYFQGQFQPHMYSQWPLHPPPGGPIFQPYPMQGMPYYPTYPGNGPFFQTPYPPTDEPRHNNSHKAGRRRHSMDSRESNVESEEGAEQSMVESEKEGHQGHKSQRKDGRSGKKKSGIVVIRNINYVTSKRKSASEDESQSASESGSDEEADNAGSGSSIRKNRNLTKSLKGNELYRKSTDAWKANDGDELVCERGTDNGNWDAFQNCRLQEEEEETKNHADKYFFTSEKEIYFKRQQSTTGADPILSHKRDLSEVSDKRMLELNTGSGNMTLSRSKMSSDVLAVRPEGLQADDSQMDVQLAEVEGGGRGYRRVSNDDFVIYGRGNRLGDVNSFSDPLAGNEYGCAGNWDKSSSRDTTDESFIVPYRSSSPDRVATDSRIAIDMDSELPSTHQRSVDSSSRLRSQLNYEPNDLTLMPERGTERESIGYDPAVDYELEVLAKDINAQNTGDEEVVSVDMEGSKTLDKEKKGSLERRKAESALRKGKPSRLNPLVEAQLQAERLRSYKADLLKMKKENEEEEIKRLEGLKRERQKRIAARSSSNSLHSSSVTTKSRLSAKLSPSSNRSKFSDSEPGSASPIPKLPFRMTSVGTVDTEKNSMVSKSNSLNIAGNGLSRSVSSLSELKKENNSNTSDPKGAPIRARRLSELRGSNSHHVSSPRSGRIDSATKPKLADEPETKKMTAIMNLDKTKSARLPELKVRAPRGPSNTVPVKPVAKETAKKVSGTKASLSSEEIKPKKGSDKGPYESHGDDNRATEKTVVRLEHKRIPAPVADTSQQTEFRHTGIGADNNGEENVIRSAYAAIHAPPLPIIVGEAENQGPPVCLFDGHSDSQEDKLPKSSILNSADEKPYQPIYARTSSLEDPCTSNVDCGIALSISSEENNIEAIKAHISDFSEPQSPGALEKPRGKESTKGFRKLLKFGRKTHGSSGGEQNVDADKLSVDSPTADHNNNMTFSDEVPTLKNLISQDESPLAGAAQKVGRPFSLLSPFRSKPADKKLIT